MLFAAAFVLLATLGADAASYPFGISEIAVERENINPLEIYAEEQSRITTVHKSSSYVTQNWTCPIDESGDHPGTWYRYLNSLYCEFSKYEVQVAKKSFNVADIEKWGLIHVPDLEKRPIYDIEAWKSSKDQGIKIDKNNFKNFLIKTEIYNIAEQDRVRSMEITGEQFNELNHVLDLTIKDQIQISCTESHMFIQGNYIIFSHMNLSISALSADDNCQKLLLKTDGLKFVNIFALNTIFVDDDIRKRTNLTVIAPKFEIIGRRTIDLNGEDAKEQNTTAVAVKSSLPGKNGEAGKPGEPGEPGGNFFGIGEKFIHGENLTISANGGRGSSGQDGGNGTKGRDGNSFRVPVFFACSDGFCEKTQTMPESALLCDNTNTECLEHISSPEYREAIYIPKQCFFRMIGEDGLQGGNAGNGGKGGKGADHGDIAFLELNGRSNVKQIKINGLNGMDGKGGVGGAGGKNGNTTVVKCEGGYGKWSMVSTSLSYQRAPSGKNGSDGGNAKNMQERRGATYIPKVDKAKIINQYKSFLRAKMDDSFRKFSLENFLNRLENDQDVKSIYDFFGFADELESLEEQFHNLNKRVNFLPFYGSLLDRISEYAQKISTSADKKVLAYLYTATLGRKHNLEDDLESNLIIDIDSYLKLVIADIKELEKLQNGKAKEDIINKYKQEYKDEIDKKIKDANDLISKEIIPQIHVIEKNIDGEIEKWVNEVVQLQNQTIIDGEKLSKSREQLENALALQKLFGVLKIVGQVVSFMGPVGAIAGSAIGLTSSLAETYMLDDSDSAVEDFEQIGKDIDSLKDKIKSFGDDKTSGLNKALKTVSSEIKDNTDEFGELYVEVTAISSQLSSFDQNKITVQQVQDLEIKLKTTLEKEKEKKDKEAGKDPKNENKQNAAAVLDHLKKVVELSSVVTDVYDKIEKSQKKVNAIHEAIKKNTEKFEKLRQLEASIYNSMVPMIEHIERDLDDVINESSTKAKVVLDVNKWKVQSKLKDLMLQMNKLTQNFTVQNNIVRYIEKLKEAMETLLNVQGYIQDYQKDQTFANFIAGISTVTVNSPEDSYLEKEYRDALRDLEIIIRSSIVIQRYKIAIDTFKQFVFPFAHLYFKGLELPSHLKLNDQNNLKLVGLVSTVVTQITQIKDKLDNYKIIIAASDSCTLNGTFNTAHENPFFKWRNNRNKNMISKLLSGKEVVVKAHITSSPINKYAIKFNFIKFYFRPKNANITQSKIDKALKNFFINVTHLGNSYYRYNDKIYLMTTPDVNFKYAFKKGGHESTSYQKIKKGNFMLSPYASWKINLFRDEDKKKSSFNDLKKIQHAVDLVLEGEGYYVLKSCTYKELVNVDQYYKAINEDNTEYRIDELNSDDFVPLLEDGTLSRDRHEINQESVMINQEHWITQNNHDRSDYEIRKANSKSWLSWF